MIAITRSACSASARTAGSAAASSPETISRPIGSGFSSSSSEHAAQASATPRAFGVAGRWNAAQPGFPSSPSRWPSSARRAPPPPPRPDQIRTARSEADTRSSSFLPSFASATWTISAPLRRAWRIQRSTIGARSATCSSPITTTISAAPIVESGARKASSPCETASGSTAEWAPRPWRSSLPSAYACSTVSEPESAVTIRPCAPRSSASARSSASSQESTVKPRRWTRSSGSTIRSSA